MLQSSFIETLLLLRPEELERFQKFVLSPYFNDGPYCRDTADLLMWLIPFAPAFDDKVLTIERAHTALYPQKKFVKGKIEVVMSKLHQLLKQFAAQSAADVFEIPETLRLATFF